MNKKEHPVKPGATGHGAKEIKVGENLQNQSTPPSSLCQSRAAQRQRVLHWLKNVGSLNTFEGRENLFVPHVAGRVQELRKQGYLITTERCWEYSAGGSRHLVARYSLEREEGK